MTETAPSPASVIALKSSQVGRRSHGVVPSPFARAPSASYSFTFDAACAVVTGFCALATCATSFLHAGFATDDEDTAGELGYSLMFGEWLDEGEARAAAAGWGGDRSVVVTRQDEIASADHLRFDPGQPSEAFAERAFGKVKKGLVKRYGKPAAEGAEFVCFERRETGPLAMLRRGRDLAFTAGPARVVGSVWTSSSTCAAARAWAEEVAAGK